MVTVPSGDQQISACPWAGAGHRPEAVEYRKRWNRARLKFDEAARPCVKQGQRLLTEPSVQIVGRVLITFSERSRRSRWAAPTGFAARGSRRSRSASIDGAPEPGRPSGLVWREMVRW